MRFSSSLFILSILLVSSFGLAQEESQDDGHHGGTPGQSTLVRCTQFSPTTGRYRFNVRIFKDLRENQIYADIHAVERYTNRGHSIGIQPVTSQIAQHSPLIVTYWTRNQSFILKVPVRYKRGSSIIDYTVEANGNADLVQENKINYYMNCFTVR